MIPNVVVAVRLDLKKIYEHHPKTVQLPEKFKDKILGKIVVRFLVR